MVVPKWLAATVFVDDPPVPSTITTAMIATIAPPLANSHFGERPPLSANSSGGFGPWVDRRSSTSVVIYCSLLVENCPWVGAEHLVVHLVDERAHDPVAGELHDLDEHHEQHDATDHDVAVELLVAVVDGEVAESPCPDRAGDRRVLDHRDDVQRQARDEPGHRLIQLDRPDHLEPARPSRQPDVDARAWNLPERVLDEAGRECDAGK